MSKEKNGNGKVKVSVIGALNEFFGRRYGETLKDFANEVKQLSDTDKMELAELAAAELGKELKTI